MTDATVLQQASIIIAFELFPHLRSQVCLQNPLTKFVPTFLLSPIGALAGRPSSITANRRCIECSELRPVQCVQDSTCDRFGRICCMCTQRPWQEKKDSASLHQRHKFTLHRPPSILLLLRRSSRRAQKDSAMNVVGVACEAQTLWRRCQCCHVPMCRVSEDATGLARVRTAKTVSGLQPLGRCTFNSWREVSHVGACANGVG